MKKKTEELHGGGKQKKRGEWVDQGWDGRDGKSWRKKKGGGCINV